MPHTKKTFAQPSPQHWALENGDKQTAMRSEVLASKSGSMRCWNQHASCASRRDIVV